MEMTEGSIGSSHMEPAHVRAVEKKMKEKEYTEKKGIEKLGQKSVTKDTTKHTFLKERLITTAGEEIAPSIAPGFPKSKTYGTPMTVASLIFPLPQSCPSQICLTLAHPPHPPAPMIAIY